MMTVKSLPESALRTEFAGRVERHAPLARYTAARIGGPADALLVVENAAELAVAGELLWDAAVPTIVLGAGSNVLISDRGVRGAVLVNKARDVRFTETGETLGVWAESGANFGAVARAAAGRGLAGLEWAAGIPGTIGGAVVGNAGAHGGDMAGRLVWADLLLRGAGLQRRPAEEMGYAYRSSALKRSAGEAIVLAAQLRLERAASSEIASRMDRYLAQRKRTQPPGASMGSMFKNPPGDFAGRLIDRAGLKSARIGEAEISERHANFFVNTGGASAAEVLALIELARSTVLERFGIELELEIELIGEWAGESQSGHENTDG